MGTRLRACAAQPRHHGPWHERKFLSTHAANSLAAARAWVAAFLRRLAHVLWPQVGSVTDKVSKMTQAPVVVLQGHKVASIAQSRGVV